MTIRITGELLNMEQVLSKNVGALITARKGSAFLSWTSGGTGDGTVKSGTSLDRESVGASGQGGIPESCVVSALYEATLGSGASLTIALGVDDSADNSNWSGYATLAAQTVATGPSGGGAVSGQVAFNVNLSSARRWVRPRFVPTLTRGGTDTGISVAVMVLGGADKLPAPA